MANVINLVTKYQPLLDEVYKDASLTKDLESNEVKFDGSKTVKILKLVVPDLGDYSRGSGFRAGDVSALWETWTLAEDRGIEFSIDAMDNEETLDMTFGKSSSEFIRTKVVPEVDMYRFAKIAQTTGVETATGVLSTGAEFESAISTAQVALDDAEAPKEGRILYITPKGYQAMKSAFANRFNNKADAYNASFTEFDGMKVVVVPQSRFVSKIEKDTDGVYSKAEDAENINFMLVAPSAIVATTKHAKLRIFSPEENQLMDAYKFQYRVYHDLFVYDNKVAGIYVHTEYTEEVGEGEGEGESSAS